MPVSQTDLAPTILEAAGIEPPWWYQTDSLWNLLDLDVGTQSPAGLTAGGLAHSADRAVFTEVSFAAGPGSHEEGKAFKSGVRTEHWKLIHDEPTDSFECYDLAVDPGEAGNLVDATPEVMPRLLEEWRRLRDKAGRAPFSPDSVRGPDLSESEVEKLKTIGYF
jgi:arylsulfatase A-like enzyme